MLTFSCSLLQLDLDDPIQDSVRNIFEVSWRYGTICGRSLSLGTLSGPCLSFPSMCIFIQVRFACFSFRLVRLRLLLLQR